METPDDLIATFQENESRLHSFANCRNGSTLATIISMNATALQTILNERPPNALVLFTGIAALMVYIGQRYNAALQRKVAPDLACKVAEHEHSRGVQEHRVLMSTLPHIKQLIENYEIEEEHRRRASRVTA